MANETNIIGLNNNYKLDFYTWKLKPIKTIGQEDSIFSPFYFQDILQIDYRKNRFITRRENKIEIINEQYGIILIKISINVNKFIINSSDQIMAFTKDFIYFYDLNAEFIKKIKVMGCCEPKS